MPGYRLHYLDSGDRILAFEEIEAPGDRDALQTARAKARRVHGGPWDLWIGDRCVHRVGQDGDPRSRTSGGDAKVRRSIWSGIEPTLDELLREQAVRALMIADHTEAKDVVATVRAVALRTGALAADRPGFAPD